MCVSPVALHAVHGAGQGDTRRLVTLLLDAPRGRHRGAVHCGVIGAGALEGQQGSHMHQTYSSMIGNCQMLGCYCRRSHMHQTYSSMIDTGSDAGLLLQAHGLYSSCARMHQVCGSMGAQRPASVVLDCGGPSRCRVGALCHH